MLCSFGDADADGISVVVAVPRESTSTHNGIRAIHFVRDSPLFSFSSSCSMLNIDYVSLPFNFLVMHHAAIVDIMNLRIFLITGNLSLDLSIRRMPVTNFTSKFMFLFLVICRRIGRRGRAMLWFYSYTNCCDGRTIGTNYCDFYSRRRCWVPSFSYRTQHDRVRECAT